MDSFPTAQFLVSFLVIVLVVHVILVTVAYLIYIERKVSAYMQDRIGPNRVGFDLGLPFLKKLFRGFGFWGLGQPLADGVKLMLKEDYAPRHVDLALFTLAPMAIIIPALIGWAVIPWGGYVNIPEFSLPIIGTIEAQRVLVAAADVNIGIIWLLTVASLGVYGVVLGGWASNSKYSFLGGLRASAGMISYEIPMGLSLLAVLLMAGTVRPQSLIEMQAQHGWFVVAQPLAAVLFLVSIMAEANRAPFDNSECEQELVGGYHTEYSSMRFGMFLLAEYANILVTSTYLAVLFLGGYHLPFIPWTHPEVVGFLPALVKFAVLFGKGLLVVTFIVAVRWTLPRIRWDQVMKLAWGSLIPASLALVLATAGMVYMGWTATWQYLVMNLALWIVIVAIQPLLPRRPQNERLRLTGSRFYPPEGESARAAPSRAEARDDGSADQRAAKRTPVSV